MNPRFPSRTRSFFLLPLLCLLLWGMAACTPPNTPIGEEQTETAAMQAGDADDGDAAGTAEAGMDEDESSAAETDEEDAEARGEMDGNAASTDDEDADAESGGDADVARVETADGDLLPVTLMLDWVPNTNHTGIFVAQAEGYFEDAGLEVDIVQPGEVMAEQAVAAGTADFGISFQESLTLARADEVPLVSLAAIIQHNTSGFASRADLGVETAADFAGLRYGTFGTPFEMPTIRALMRCAGADEEAIASVEEINVGLSDPLALLGEEQIDLAWIFQGWQGEQAERQDIELDVIMLDDHFDCIPDYYTPILVASEETVEERPDVAAAFVGAVSRGYRFAIERPLDAAAILTEAVPELELGLVLDSQTWLSPRYQADAPRWGEQQAEVWDAYSDWMASEGILPAPIDPEAAFTNQFLP